MKPILPSGAVEFISQELADLLQFKENEIQQLKYVERAVFGAGAETMRDVLWQEAVRLKWSPSASVRIKNLPLPEPPQ